MHFCVLFPPSSSPDIGKLLSLFLFATTAFSVVLLSLIRLRSTKRPPRAGLDEDGHSGGTTGGLKYSTSN